MNRDKRRTREELRQAILHVERRRPKRIRPENCRMTISAVAREAGMSAASIHNMYPDLAETIRTKAQPRGRSRLNTEDLERAKLLNQLRNARERLKIAEQDLVRIASENARLVPIYRRRRFEGEIVELSVRWYISYRLSHRDLLAMMAERGLIVLHTKIMRWVMRYVPEFEKRWNRWARDVNSSYRVDEIYISVRCLQLGAAPRDHVTGRCHGPDVRRHRNCRSPFAADSSAKGRRSRAQPIAAGFPHCGSRFQSHRFPS